MLLIVGAPQSMDRRKEMEKERKFMTVPFDIKRLHEDKGMFTFEGFASTFGNTDLDDDIIDLGAFKKSLAKRIPKLLWQHSMDEPLGVFNSIEEQEPGLFIKAQMPLSDTFVSGRVIPQIKIGSITSMSIGFRVIEATFNRDTNIRNIHEVELFEISLVSIPANPQAVITTFKRADMENFFSLSLREQEDLFTSGVKFSNRTAKELVSVLKNKKNEIDSQDKTDREGHKGMDNFLKSLECDREDHNKNKMNNFLKSFNTE